MYCLATLTRNVTLPSPMFGFSTGAAGDGTDGSHSERTARLMVLCLRMICNIYIDGNRKSTCSGAYRCPTVLHDTTRTRLNTTRLGTTRLGTRG
jgi:hypothetical protein